MVANFSVIGLTVCLILTIIFDVCYKSDIFKGGLPTNTYDWLLLVVIGLLSYGGQVALTVSLQIEAAGIISLMRKAFDIIFAYAFQVALFDVSTDNCPIYRYTHT